MSPKTTVKTSWNLASLALQDAYTDFILSRQAMNCTPATLQFYRFTVGKFLEWMENQGVTSPAEVTARHVRMYLATLIDRGRKDTTLHANARAIRTLLRFWHAEKYIPEVISFAMPRLEKKRLPSLNADQLKEILKACSTREKAIVLFMADSGLRRMEVCALNWNDVDMGSGLIRVKQGKGKKDRSAVVGATTRRALLAYRRAQRKAGTFLKDMPKNEGGNIETLKQFSTGTTLVPVGESAPIVRYQDGTAQTNVPTLADLDIDKPLFQTKTGTRFTGNGLMMLFRRLSKRTGIHVSPHMLRRTFTILSLRAGMDVLHLQRLGGWESLDMVDRYAQMEDIDLLQAHKAHSPVDSL